MKDLIIEETTETPEIKFKEDEGLLKISGRAYSSDITFFYKELDKWLEEYLLNPKDKTTIELYLDYYNSVFHKLLFNFLKKSLIVKNKGKQLVIKWFYNEGDEDSMDACMHYAKSLDYPIEKIES
ncbi:MAG: SiaC family regulatory phosphoprotein [Bacteroidia bacterium]